MGAAFFYHLTRSPIEATLPMLLSKSLQAGWRVVVRGSSAARMEWIDAKLWLGSDESFLPHGLSGGPFDAEQPILLTTKEDNPNGAVCLMAIDGAGVSAAECSNAERVCVVFDGNDAKALNRAREQWKELTEAGVSAQYWSEETGHWEKKAEK